MPNSDSTTLIQYDELVQRHDAAYTAFKSIYASKMPPPEMKSTGVDWLSVGALGFLVVASITVSGSRTIDEFGGGLIGIAAFVMLEIALIAYAYWRTKKASDIDQHATVRNRATFGMWLAFGVSLAANLHATLKHGGIDTPPLIDVAILVAIAISAPSLALIAGDMLGMEAVAGLALRARAEAEYQVAYGEWLVGLNTSWDRQKRQWGIRVEAVRDDETPVLVSLPASHVPSHETRHSETERRSGYGFQRTADGETQVLNYFREHPDEVNLPVRELEEKIGVSKSTVSRARRKWINETGEQS